MSAAYYVLFHCAIEAGSSSIATGQIALQAQVSRAYNHGTMRKVCEDFWRASSGKMNDPLASLLPAPPDPRLTAFAGAFVQLQSARVIADYDLSVPFLETFARERVALAMTAATGFQGVRHLPETAVFLIAMLLADRWTRRG